MGLCTPHPHLLSCVKKVGKDTQGTFWFLDLRQREGVAPSRLPQWRIELVEILRGVECKIFRLLPLTRVSSIFSFRGLVPPTLAHPFFLRRKDAKTYQRGGVLFEITSGGSFPHSHFVTFPLCLSRRFGILLGESRGGNAPFLSEVKEPRGSLCVFGNFLHIRKLPRCGARSSTK